MLVDIASFFEFVPEWADNHKAPESEQFTVRCEFLTVAETNKLMLENLEERRKKNFLAYCKEVKNLTVNLDGKQVKVTPEKIIELPGLDGLFVEITQEYASRSAVDKKK